MSDIRILLLEDNEFDQELTKLELQSSKISHTLTWVKNASAFVDKLESEVFDLVLSDYNVPGFNGIEAIETAQRIAPSIPFIYVSGQMGEELAIEALKAGATDYVLKGNLGKLGFCINRAIREFETNMEKERAVKETLDTARYLQALTQYAPFIIIHYNSDLEAQYVNDFESLGVADCSEVDLLSICIDDERAFLESCILKTIGSQQETTFEITARKNKRHYLAKTAPLHTRGGEFILVLIDNTENWLARKRLKESELKFRKLAENINTPIFIYQGENFVYVNKAAIEQTQYTEKELLSMNPYDLVYDRGQEQYLQQLGNAFSSKTGNVEGVVKLNVKDGRPAYFISNVSRIIYNEKKALIGSAINITQIQESHDETRLLANQLKKKNEELENYTHIVSHNLRAPLSNILGLTDLAANYTDSKQSELLNLCAMIRASAVSLDTTVKDLIYSLSLQEVGDRFKSLNLPNAVEKVVTTLNESFGEKALTYSADYAAFEHVHGIPGYLSSILQNILENAVKYRHPDRCMQVSITTENARGNKVIVIKDNGIGIDFSKVEKSRIFGLYQRLNIEVEGKGLGLYIVKKQIEALGWEIDVESVLGSGTTFTIKVE